MRRRVRSREEVWDIVELDIPEIYFRSPPEKQRAIVQALKRGADPDQIEWEAQRTSMKAMQAVADEEQVNVMDTISKKHIRKNR